MDVVLSDDVWVTGEVNKPPQLVKSRHAAVRVAKSIKRLFITTSENDEKNNKTHFLR